MNFKWMELKNGPVRIEINLVTSCMRNQVARRNFIDGFHAVLLSFVRKLRAVAKLVSSHTSSSSLLNSPFISFSKGSPSNPRASASPRQAC